MRRVFLTTAAILCLRDWVSAQTPEPAYPIVPNAGGVLPLPKAGEPPRKGAKVVIEVTADAKPADVNNGLERAARLLSLYGSEGLKASDVTVTVVIHSEATKSVLLDHVYKEKLGAAKNPNLAMIGELRKPGVES
jgi:hypothetical protein